MHFACNFFYLVKSYFIMSALESNPKPEKQFKKCLIILILSGINNFLNKLNLVETFGIFGCFAEIPSGRMRWNWRKYPAKENPYFPLLAIHKQPIRPGDKDALDVEAFVKLIWIAKYLRFLTFYYKILLVKKKFKEI